MITTTPTRILSSNQLRSMHWAKAARMKKAWRDELWILAGKKRRRRVRKDVIIYSYRARKLDPANIMAGVNLILDSLKWLGWIWDDSEAWIHLWVYQEIDRENQRTTIEIKPCKQKG